MLRIPWFPLSEAVREGSARRLIGFEPLPEASALASEPSSDDLEGFTARPSACGPIGGSRPKEEPVSDEVKLEDVDEIVGRRPEIFPDEWFWLDEADRPAPIAEASEPRDEHPDEAGNRYEGDDSEDDGSEEL